MFYKEYVPEYGSDLITELLVETGMICSSTRQNTVTPCPTHPTRLSILPFL
jgi:hypothetical protein